NSRVFDVEITIPNRDNKLRPGMIGTVALGRSSAQQAATSAQTLTLPLSAVVRAPNDATRYAVLVVERSGDDEIARMRGVELGAVVGNSVAVINGVSAGDRVITTGATLLTDGDRIHVIP